MIISNDAKVNLQVGTGSYGTVVALLTYPCLRQRASRGLMSGTVKRQCSGEGGNSEGATGHWVYQPIKDTFGGGSMTSSVSYIF